MENFDQKINILKTKSREIADRLWNWEVRIKNQEARSKDEYAEFLAK